MALLQKASLIVTPNAEKAGKLYSVIPADGSGDMTVVRGTTATRVNSLGLIENVAVNEPRLNYDTVGGCPAILIEPQRTNLALRSEEFENASWSKNGITITANSTISPSGLMNADTIVSTITGQARVEQPLALPSVNTTYTFSVYAKTSSSPFVALTRFSGAFGAIFNLANGTVVSQFGGVNPIIISVGNGWYRISIVVNVLTTDTANAWKIHPCTSTDAFASAVGNSVFLWGAQLEQGAYATSYIPTLGSAITRNADSLTRANIFTNNLITSAGGTWFIHLRNNIALKRDASTPSISIDTSTLTNGFSIKHTDATSNLRLTVVKVISFAQTNIFTTTTDTVKIAIKWNGTTADVFQNGVKVITATAFTTTAMQNLSLLGTDVQKSINSTMLFPTPLTDTECINLTTL